MSNVKWVKITTDMFDNKKIKHIRKMPEGNNIVLIWIMLLTMAGRCNASGFIFLTENIPYTPKMLADELGFEESVIQIALNVLEKFNMIHLDGNLLSIPGWEEHQNIDGMEKIRQQTSKRVAAYRERQKKQAELLECNVTETLQKRYSNADVTQQNKNQNLESDKDKDIEKEIYKEKETKETIKRIVDYLNDRCHTNYKPTTTNTVKHINARLNEGYEEEDFYVVIDKKSDEWIGTEHEKYLRPNTLFGTNFEAYLNQKIIKSNQRNGGGIDWSKV